MSFPWLALLSLVVQLLRFFTNKAQASGQLEAGAALGILKQTEDINARVAAAAAARSGQLPDDTEDPNNRDNKQ